MVVFYYNSSVRQYRMIQCNRSQVRFVIMTFNHNVRTDSVFVRRFLIEDLKINKIKDGKFSFYTSDLDRVTLQRYTITEGQYNIAKRKLSK